MRKDKGKKVNEAGGVSEKERSKSSRGAKVFLYCMILTAILYGFLLYLEKTILQEVEVVDVYVVKADVGEKVLITEENAATYFAKASRAVDTIPVGCVQDISEIYNSFTTKEYVVNDIITASGFTSEKSKIEDIVNPVEVSISVSSISQAVGGILRAGDYVNVWTVSATSYNGVSDITAACVGERAYVSRAFNSSGVELERGTIIDNSTATVINIIMSEDDEEEFNIALASGTIRLALCMYDEREVIEAELEHGGEEETEESQEVGMPILMQVPEYTAQEIELWKEAELNTTEYYQDQFGNLIYSDNYDFTFYYDDRTGYITIGDYRYEAYLNDDGSWYIPASVNAAILQYEMQSEETAEDLGEN